MRALNTVVAGAVLATVAWLAFPSVATAQQVDRSGAGITYTLTVRVPTITKVVIDQNVLDRDGNPVARVVTNDPILRAALAQGIRPEVLRQAGVRYAAEGRGKGGEAAMEGNTAVDTGLVRYTIVQP